MMKKSTKCTILLTSLILLSAGVNAIFIGTDGGRAAKQAQRVERQAPALQQISAVDARPAESTSHLEVR